MRTMEVESATSVFKMIYIQCKSREKRNSSRFEKKIAVLRKKALTKEGTKLQTRILQSVSVAT